MAAVNSTTGEQVRIQLSTRDPHIELPEPTGAILVPTNLKRYALSTLVNTLRDTAGTPQQQPFSFLVDGQFLTTSLADHLAENGLSAETVLDLEYVRATLPPKHAGSFVHDDWVGAVDVLSGQSPAASASPSSSIHPGSERILSGSDDGMLRLWNMSGECMATSTRDADHPRTLPMIKAARFTSAGSFVSAGWDMRIRSWNIEAGGAMPATTPTSLVPSADYYGHTAPINSLAVHVASGQMLSASADSTAKLWRLPSSPSTVDDGQAMPEADPGILSQIAPNAANASKRARKSSSSLGARHDQKQTAYNVPTYGPTATLAAHTAAVHAAVFSAADPTVAYTSSSDRTLRTHDLTTARAVTSRTPMPHVALLSLCAALPELGLLAAGGSNGTIALVDPREGQSSSTVALTCRGHRNAVVSIDAAPLSAPPQGPRRQQQGAGGGGGAVEENVGVGGASRYSFVSGSHDGTVAVWDVRNTRIAAAPEHHGGGRKKTAEPVWRVPRRRRQQQEAGGEGSTQKQQQQQQKVFAVRWDAAVGIVSGGEDCAVQVDRM